MADEPPGDARASRESGDFSSARFALAEAKREQREAKEASRRPIMLTGCRPYDFIVKGGYELVRGRYEKRFSGIIMAAICVAAGSIGAQTYEIDLSWVATMDLVLWIIFFSEIIIKVVSEGAQPHRILWRNPDFFWNSIDIFVVVLSNPFQKFFSGSMVVRLLRLFRVGKLTNAEYLPQVKMIFEGLTEALKAASFIILLLGIIFYLFAVVGIYVFRANDPWHFNDVGRAATTLFRSATIEDYSHVMYINMYGCDKFKNVYADTDNILPLTDNGYTNKNLDDFKCTQPEAFPVFASIYFVVFILISSFITMSLFIGAITVSMGDKMSIIRERRALKRRARVEAKQEIRTRKLSMMSMAREKTDAKKSFRAAIMIDRRDRENFEVVKRVMLNISGDPESVKRGMGLSNNKGRYPEDEALPRFLQEYIVFSAIARKFVDSTLFSTTITLVCLLAAVVVGIETSSKLMADASVANMVAGCDLAILAIFATEVVLKLVAEDTRPWMYFTSAWNVFDFTVVAINMAGLVNVVVAFRIIRLFRLLKLVQNYPQLSVMASALISGVASMWSIGVILALVFFLFGIAAVLLFRENDPFHFQNLHVSMLSLFRAGTGEDWTDIMYTNMYGCDNYGMYLDPHDRPHPDECTDPTPRPAASALFFCFFYIIGALIMLNLFVGVITTAMDEAQTRHRADRAADKEVLQYAKEVAIGETELQGYRAAFRMMDLDNSGVLDEDEIVESFIELRRLMDINDSSKNMSELKHKLLEACDWDDIPGLMEQEFVRFIHEMYQEAQDDMNRTPNSHISEESSFDLEEGSEVKPLPDDSDGDGRWLQSAAAPPSPNRKNRGTHLDSGSSSLPPESPSTMRRKASKKMSKEEAIKMRGRAHSDMDGSGRRLSPTPKAGHSKDGSRRLSARKGIEGSEQRSERNETPTTTIKKGKMQVEWLESEVRRLSKLLATKDLENDRLVQDLAKARGQPVLGAGAHS